METLNAIPPGEDDFSALVALLDEAGLPEAGLRDHLASTRVFRSSAGSLAASGALELYGEVALLRSVAVATTLRGQGLGRRMTQAMLGLAGERGVREVFLLTETAEQFFEGFGFAGVDRASVPAAIRSTVEFASACPASATVMRLELDRPRRIEDGEADT